MTLLFIQGFFLSKNELLIKSECHQYPLQKTANSTAPYIIDYNQIFNALHINQSAVKCWTKPKYDKIIILIIDALKFEFVSPLIDKNDIEIKYYSNRLTSIHDLLN